MPPVEDCGNGVDDDGDGAADCADTNCAGQAACGGTCGNGQLDAQEACDGALLDGKTCQDLGFDAGQLACAPSCALDTAGCTKFACGNGVKEGAEACDDGNVKNGDGCRSDCKGVEQCGDGLLDAGEVCDDKNMVSGDGCDADCKPTFTTCGDGIHQTGEICFAPQLDWVFPDRPYMMSLRDHDGDGDVDVLASYELSSLQILPRGAGYQFGPRQTLSLDASPSTFRLADLDGDGDLDIASLTETSNGYLRLLQQQSDGSFVVAHALAGVGQMPGDMALGDVDGDGDADIVVCRTYSSGVLVYKNQGLFQLSAPQSLATGATPKQVVLADLDGDGDMDIATVNKGDSSVSLLRNEGNGAFAATVKIPVGTEPISLDVADLDGDGDRDLITANLGSNDLTRLYNQGGGSFNAVPLSLGVRPVDTEIADYDADGWLDIAVRIGPTAGVGPLDEVRILQNDGGGGFLPKSAFLTGATIYNSENGRLQAASRPPTWTATATWTWA
ncbi:FG-GAP-like repeat-containing protein [Polyangium mundeleinium]|uniref:FG-GAP-like repeat-containing protein n=1 Tax=Polyangium mundeleinium TaxID=2995306 RepID=A0ABT5EP01_9BACT|nr:FG-GAP-like repeat-containing protein [Polyangium mundeleinium]MDC0743573.1 FG-GAP-like repeat-containing protein [Polyangium mundeleinium]